MRITVLGASGNIGQRLTKLLLDNGHVVTAMVHSKDLPGLSSPKLHIITGDVHDLSDLKKAVKGSEVVVSTLGSWGTKTKDIVGTATKNVIPAMQAAGIKRFVSVTGGAARLPNEAEAFSQKMTRLTLGLVAKPILTDAEEHLRLLNECDLDWTAIRSPVMSNKKTSLYGLALTPPSPLATVSRTAVAQALVDVIEKDIFKKQAPFISGK